MPVVSPGTRRQDAVAWLVIIVAYAVAHGALFGLGPSLFWDDWMLVNVSPQALVDMYAQQGSPWLGAMHAALLGGPGAGGYRLIVFLAHLCAGCCLHGVLGRVDGLTRADRALLTLLYLLAPFFWSRVTLITVTYSLAVALFHAGWYLAVRRWPQTLPARLASMLAIIVACVMMPSLLVFFALPAAHLAWLLREDIQHRNIGAWLAHAPWFAAPLIAWAGKTWLFPASGAFEGYNRFRHDLGHWYAAVDGMAFEFLRLLVPTALVVAMLPPAWIAVRALGGGERGSGSARTLFAVLAAGTVIAYLAVFPYLAVGKIPSYIDWVSRHQVLLPLGAAILAWAPGLVLPPAPRIAWFTGIVALFLAVNLGFHASVLRDAIKQEAMMQAFAREEALAAGSTFAVIDGTVSWNVAARRYRPYEWSAMLDHVLGGPGSHYAASWSDGTMDEWLLERDQETDELRQLGMYGSYRPAPVDCVLRIERGGLDLSGFRATLHAVLVRTFAPARYRRDILPSLLSVRCLPADRPGG